MLVPMGARRVRCYGVAAVSVVATMLFLWPKPPAIAVNTLDGELMVLPLRSGEGSIELRVKERTARYELLLPESITPRRDLGLLTYMPMDGQAVDRFHDVAKNWQVRGYAVNAHNGRQVGVLLRVPGPILIPTLSDYFRTLQAANQQILSKEDASRLFGMTLNAFKQTGLIPLYEQYNPR